MTQWSSFYPFLDQTWEHDVLPTLEEYIRIPNKSPMFDADWQKNGHMERAVQLIVAWCKRQPIPNMKLEVVHVENRTPLLFIEIPGTTEPQGPTVLLYGHLDKQPEMSGWLPDLDPWKPVRKGDQLFGRGGADDGYAIFGILTAIRLLQQQKIPHERCVILIEACEESGSVDLPFYLQHLQARIGTPELVICLDSGCLNYEQLWCTNSLRGVIGGTFKINVAKYGTHSGSSSGVIPGVFDILRTLLDRVHNSETGQMLLPEFHVEIPAQNCEQAKYTAQVFGSEFFKSFPLQNGVHPMTTDVSEAILNRTWRPALTVTGAEGLPEIAKAGNVTRPSLSVRLSIRIPPMCDGERALAALQNALLANPPYAAQVEFIPEPVGTGWSAPPLAPWLAKANEEASLAFYGKPCGYFGEGGTIPFMAMLGQQFPKAQFSIVGVLGPHSNAHGPNEFLHITMAKKLTGCVAYLLSAHRKAVRDNC